MDQPGASWLSGERKRVYRASTTGAAAWSFLLGLLLGTDGPLVCAGSNEPSVDCGASWLHPSGEGSSERPMAGAAHWGATHWLGGLDDCRTLNFFLKNLSILHSDTCHT